MYSVRIEELLALAVFELSLTPPKIKISNYRGGPISLSQYLGVFIIIKIK